MLDYDIPRVHVDIALYLTTEFKPDYIKKVIEMAKEKNADCDQLFQGKGNIFVMNCYNIL